LTLVECVDVFHENNWSVVPLCVTKRNVRCHVGLLPLDCALMSRKQFILS